LAAQQSKTVRLGNFLEDTFLGSDAGPACATALSHIHFLAQPYLADLVYATFCKARCNSLKTLTICATPLYLGGVAGEVCTVCQYCAALFLDRGLRSEL
jgi:hypothetical protein